MLTRKVAAPCQMTRVALLKLAVLTPGVPFFVHTLTSLTIAEVSSENEHSTAPSRLFEPSLKKRKPNPADADSRGTAALPEDEEAKSPPAPIPLPGSVARLATQSQFTSAIPSTPIRQIIDAYPALRGQANVLVCRWPLWNTDSIVPGNNLACSLAACHIGPMQHVVLLVPEPIAPTLTIMGVRAVVHGLSNTDTIHTLLTKIAAELHEPVDNFEVFPIAADKRLDTCNCVSLVYQQEPFLRKSLLLTEGISSRSALAVTHRYDMTLHVTLVGAAADQRSV
jgi:hypothetical protein